MWRYFGQDRACEAVEVLVGVEAWLVKPASVMEGGLIVARVGERCTGLACRSTQTALQYDMLHVQNNAATITHYCKVGELKTAKLYRHAAACLVS
jgi:hypothetical protein